MLAIVYIFDFANVVLRAQGVSFPNPFYVGVMTHGFQAKSKLLIASLDRILTEYIMVMQVVKP